MAYMVLFVLNDPEKLDKVLDAWREAGVLGATILESTGQYRRKLKKVHARYMFSMLQEGGTNNYTLMAVVNDEAKVEACLKASEDMVGDLNMPHAGVFTAWPLTFTKGVNFNGAKTGDN